MLSIDHTLFGGKINTRTLQHIIHNAYVTNPKAKDSIDGYTLDKSLSGKRAQVYYNDKTGHLVVNQRGTKGIHDVMTDK